MREAPKTLFKQMTGILPRSTAYRGHTTLNVDLDRFRCRRAAYSDSALSGHAEMPSHVKSRRS
jgi:hypothetical protein